MALNHLSDIVSRVLVNSISQIILELSLEPLAVIVCVLLANDDCFLGLWNPLLLIRRLNAAGSHLASL